MPYADSANFPPRQPVYSRSLEEIQLEKNYAAAIQQESIDIVAPTLELTDCRIYETQYNNHEKTAHLKLVTLARDAIIARDNFTLNLLIGGKSELNTRIRAAQETQQIRLQWIKLHAENLLYKRALYLLSWYQKILYYNNAIIFLLENTEQTLSYNKKLYCEYYSRKFDLLKLNSTVNETLLIDLFVNHFQSDEYSDLRNILCDPTHSIHHRYLLNYTSRKLNRENCSYILKMFNEQLINDANPINYSHVSDILYHFIGSLDPAYHSKESINELNAEAIFALRSSSEVFDQLQAWLKKKLRYGVDIYFIYTSIESHINHIEKALSEVNKNNPSTVIRYKFINDFLNDDMRSYPRLVSQSKIVVACLDSEEYYVNVIDSITKKSILTIAIDTYLSSKVSTDIYCSFECIKILIARGCVVKNLTAFEKQQFLNISFENFCYFNLAILENLQSPSRLIQNLIRNLVDYSKDTLIEISSWYWKHIYSIELKKQRMQMVHDLADAIADAPSNQSLKNIKDKILEIYQSRCKSDKMINSRLEKIILRFVNDFQRMNVNDSATIKLFNRVPVKKPLSSKYTNKQLGITDLYPNQRFFTLDHIKILRKKEEKKNSSNRNIP